MTTPKVNTIRRGGSRFYVEPTSGRKNPGVTSVTGMLPKEFLKWWAAKSVAQYAIDNIGSVVGVAMNDPAAAVDLLKGAPNRDTRQAADIGSEAHDAFEEMAKGNQPRVTPAIKPFVDHFQEFLDIAKPEFIFTEETVWNDEVGYAGSFDALATLTGDVGDLKGKTLWFDWKTTRSGVHEEVALQLTGYRNATHIVRPDGSKVPLPKTHGAAVLHVRPEGWKLVPVETAEVELTPPIMDPDDPDRVIVPGQTVNVFDYFTALRTVFDWEMEVKRHVLGAPIIAGGEFADEKPVINRPKGAKK